MSGLRSDDEFEAFLRTRVVLRDRNMGSEKLEPPEDLDNIVLTKARHAIQAPQQMPVYRAPRWALPVALAATILLSLSVALNVSLNGSKPPAALAKSEMPAAAPSAAGEQTPAAPATEATAQEPAMRSTAASPPPPIMAKPAPAQTAIQASQEEFQAKADITLKSTAHKATDEARNAGAARASGNPTDPSLWLKRIETLRAQGQGAVADAELRRFRAAFPHYPLRSSTPSP
jgi:hypothetical protein